MIDVKQYICKRWGLNADALPPIVELRDFGRDGLADLFREVGCKAGAEIGVQAGDYSAVLCRANPQATIWSVDPWLSYQGYHYWTRQEAQEANKKAAIRALAGFANNRILQATSTDAAKQFAKSKRKLDFVYIDGNHDYAHVSEDLTVWSERVRSGGIIAGHDYIERTKKFEFDMQVVNALRDFMGARGITPLFLLGTRAILPGEVRDRPRSWLFINP